MRKGEEDKDVLNNIVFKEHIDIVMVKLIGGIWSFYRNVIIIC